MSKSKKYNIQIDILDFQGLIMHLFVKKLFPIIVLTSILFLLLIKPTLTLEYASQGLSIWYKSMLPTLFPMMILSGCMIKMNITSTISSLIYPVTKHLFHISKNGTYALFIGLLCGFPMGAKVICELYNQNKLSKEEATTLLPICNNIGPIYMLSYGLKAFHAKPIYIILILFYCIPLAYAFLTLRKKHFVDLSSSTIKHSPFVIALDESISDSALGMLSLGGYLMFFNILLVPLELLSLNPYGKSFFSCCIEITNGLSKETLLPPYIYLTLLQFGGICCIFQTLKYTLKTDLNFCNYIFSKIKLSLITLIFFFAYYVFVSYVSCV